MICDMAYIRRKHPHPHCCQYPLECILDGKCNLIFGTYTSYVFVVRMRKRKRVWLSLARQFTVCTQQMHHVVSVSCGSGGDGNSTIGGASESISSSEHIIETVTNEKWKYGSQCKYGRQLKWKTETIDRHADWLNA